MKVTVGQRLASTVCDTEIIVLKGGGGEVELLCGGAEMTDPAGPAAHGSPLSEGSSGEGTLLGKRYVDSEGSVELLCTKAGLGTLTVSGRALAIKSAKSLPSSD